jgi:hypothetical protein
MKIAVIASDAVHLVNVGGELERTYKAFDIPEEMASYIRKIKPKDTASYISISLAIEDD